MFDASMPTILLTPLISAVIIALLLRRQGNLAAGVSVAAAGIICVLSLKLIFGKEGLNTSYKWLELGALQINLGFLWDANTATMLFVVAFVGFWIHVFSLGYMHNDEGKARYFGGLSIFMFSMLGIVFADNLFMIFIFWELVGFSSYMLIAHYHKTDEASRACRKAFIVNRVGDLGFVLGILLTFWSLGTANISELQAIATQHPDKITNTIGLLLMCGFIGKSAQFPLHVWLPDAMAGPTPVSALIHAATMVAAGIYFLIRIQFLITTDVLTLIVWLGAAMALYAGICALTQRDIKKILAYSTLSQLGYMSAAFGLGYTGIALFHLTTHAFFKALMFLGSGSVIYGCHHEQDIFKMGGLYKRMPVTAFTFGIGVLAISGVPFLSGFFSKDAILIAANLKSTPIFLVLMAAAVLTAFYMGRLYWITFLGKSNSEHAEHAKETPVVMWLPLVVLATLSIIGGYQNFPYIKELFHAFHGSLEKLHHEEGHDAAHNLLLVLGTVAWVVGLGGSYIFYKAGSSMDNLERQQPKLFGILRKALFFDPLYNFYVAKIQNKVADIIDVIDKLIIQGVLVRGSAGILYVTGLFTRMLHGGNLQYYSFWVAIGVLILGAFALGWIG
ncbi:MAG: NADH-quinone oxidoreductase subunit L [Opitutae bacterium]|jgi:NADH-quinone oxidoreductase subunit L|nr:NADH-quinone oxidoreductase subunit L [Opitutae bacterium]MBT5379000.1 NADH-quinone oxidoreductase subunit L [Opitutae bacterium]MBT5689939.1 NADH-quinone oxidoreductase subunit L [Opitutae bacterium]MBT6958621.1 NADH-quinone oxidoreductase subunit L [Opitutae bacterium]MBT7853758.1 NADH-quinone oxidoreductase subunit L [Opitutae bacterium]